MADYYLEQDMCFASSWGEDQEPEWKTKEGKCIPVSRMTKKHINNTIKMLERRKEEADIWIEIFKDELEYRKK